MVKTYFPSDTVSTSYYSPAVPTCFFCGGCLEVGKSFRVSNPGARITTFLSELVPLLHISFFRIPGSEDRGESLMVVFLPSLFDSSLSSDSSLGNSTSACFSFRH